MSSEFSLPREITAKAERASQDFSIHLANMTKVQIKDELDGHLAAIQEQGRRLCRHMTLGDLKRFKQMVTEFLNLVINGGLKLERDKMYSGRGRSKLLYIIKTVDEKLLQLAEEVLSQNKDAFKIMALVDEIRGLLLDLYA